MLVVTCTGGERGSVLNPKLDRPEILGEHHRDPARPRWTGRGRSSACARSGSASSTPACPRATRCRRCRRAASAWSTRSLAPSRWSRLIREFRPHVVLTYDENGGYPHPDHIMCHNVSVVAFDAAGDPDRYPGTGEPWQPLKLYYHMGFSKQRIVDAARGDAGGRARVAVRGVAGELGPRATSERDRGRGSPPGSPCGDYFHVRDDALRAHATQVDPDGFWFRVPMEIQQAAWPTEDYELARSLVDTVAARGRPVRRGPGDARSGRARAAVLTCGRARTPAITSGA